VGSMTERPIAQQDETIGRSVTFVSVLDCPWLRQLNPW
jgi:hypothetical protein